MEAIVLAGGEGKRMGDLVKDAPKHFLEIANRPLIDYPMRILFNSKNVDNILLSVQEKYKDTYIKRFGDGTDKIKISYNSINNPNIIKVLKENTELLKENSFILLLGDSVLDINIDMVVNSYKLNEGKYSIIIVSPKIIQLVGVDPHKNGIKSLFKTKKIDYEVCGAILNKNDINWDIDGDFLESVYDGLAKKRKLKFYKFFGYHKNINTYKDFMDAKGDVEGGKTSFSRIF